MIGNETLTDICCTYDSVNQLTKIEYPTYTEQLYYDKAGNRSRRITDGTQEEYRYAPANHLTEYTRGGETTRFTYDKAGNLTADDRVRYTYDLFNRTEKVETFDGHIQINHYDAEGLRSGIEEDGRLVQFIFRDQEVVTQLEEEKGMIRYIRGYDLIASDADCARTYYHYASDELGSITHVVAGEDILNRYEYDAWGNLTLCEEKVENRFKFNGQQYDPISQQYYLRARYYNPVIGRFTQEDTYRGDGLNLYAYCRNNPVYYADPSGHSCDKDANDRHPDNEQVGGVLLLPAPEPMLALPGPVMEMPIPDPMQELQRNRQLQELSAPEPILALPGPVLDTATNRLNGPEPELPASTPLALPGPGETSSRRAEAERKLLEAASGINNRTIDPLTGIEVGRLIADDRGNVMIEPVGGSTVPAGPNGIDTHTLYPNGSNYQRYNPQGHRNNSTPHGHGHLMGTGPNRRGQGDSIDVFGNVVPFNSPDAHWPIK